MDGGKYTGGGRVPFASAGASRPFSAHVTPTGLSEHQGEASAQVLCPPFKGQLQMKVSSRSQIIIIIVIISVSWVGDLGAKGGILSVFLAVSSRGTAGGSGIQVLVESTGPAGCGILMASSCGRGEICPPLHTRVPLGQPSDCGVDRKVQTASVHLFVSSRRLRLGGR